MDRITQSCCTTVLLIVLCLNSYSEQERVNDYYHSHTRDNSHSVPNHDIHNNEDDKWTTYQEDSHQHDSKITNNIPPPLPLPMQPPLDAFKDSPSKPVTEYDVQAILSNVNTPNSFNLKKEKKRQKHKLSQKPSKTGTTTGNKLLSADTVPSFNNTRIPLKTVDSDKISIRHGSAEPIATSVLLSEHYSRKDKLVREPQRHKRKHSVLEDDKSDSENEHIDVEGGFVPQLTVDSPLTDINQVTMKQPFYANNVDNGSRNKSLIVHFPLKQLSLKCTKLPVDVCIRSFEQRLPEEDNCNDVSNDSNVHLEQQQMQQRIKKEKKHRRREKKAAKKLKLKDSS